MNRDRTIICACGLALGVLWWLIAAPVLSSAGHSHRISTPGLLLGWIPIGLVCVVALIRLRKR
jgi:hypothetical protein